MFYLFLSISVYKLILFKIYFMKNDVFSQCLCVLNILVIQLTIYLYITYMSYVHIQVNHEGQKDIRAHAGEEGREIYLI